MKTSVNFAPLKKYRFCDVLNLENQYKSLRKFFDKQ